MRGATDSRYHSERVSCTVIEILLVPLRYCHLIFKVML